MNNYFFNIFYKNLIKEDFKLIELKFDTKNIICFIKQYGNNIYFICPLKYSNDYKYIFEQCKNYIQARVKTSGSKLFFLELLISEIQTPEITEYITYNSDLDSQFIYLRWLVNICKNDIIVKGNQADEFLNINKIINNSLNSDFDNKSIQETIIEQNFNKTKYLKSKNINFTICLISILIFIHFYLLSKNLHNLYIISGSTSPDMFANKQYYRIFTSAFLHLSISHLFSNCLSLYIFGSRVERYMGKINFFIIYFIGIISSSLFTYLFSNYHSVGASGAIFALEGAILYYSIKTKRKLDGLDFFVFLILSILGISSGFIYSNVDNLGHIGGFISGIIVSYILTKSDNTK